MAELTTDDGIRLHVETEGEGPVVVFSAGYCQTGENFLGQVEPLRAAGFRVVRWDYRGHGRSEAPPEPAAYSTDRVLLDLKTVVDWASPDRPVVLAGLSFGGLASLHFSLRHPDRVRALVLIATGPGFKKAEAQEGWAQQVGRIAERLERSGFDGWTEGAAAVLAIGQRPDLPAAQSAGRAILAQSPSGVAHFGREVTASAPGVVDDLPQIEQPTLILVGAKDKAFLRAGEVMAARMPNARHVVVPDAGHVLNIEQSERFNSEVLAFLGNLESPTP